MPVEKYKHLYGPVESWRLGRSLGIDPLSQTGKVCNFDCIYCQLGNAPAQDGERKIYVPTDQILGEIAALGDIKIDFLTFSGRGEPTLAANLGELIDGIRNIRGERIAIITNSTLINDPGVIDDLSKVDYVIAKLDASTVEDFQKINQPNENIKFNDIIEGLKEFRTRYFGRFALQIMFTEENKHCAQSLAELAQEIEFNEVQLNTPLRDTTVKALSKTEMDKIKKYFKGINCLYVYDQDKPKSKPINTTATLKRRGKEC